MSIEAISDMEITFPLSADALLKLAPVAQNGAGYPTSQLQKGLVLISAGQELAEEGVGFGVPLLKFGLKTIFPGAIELSDRKESQEITAVYHLNLEERLIGRNRQSLQSVPLYRIKNRLEDLYRRFPVTRQFLTALSNVMRWGFSWQNIYEYAGCDYPLRVHYTVDSQPGILGVELDFSKLPEHGLTEVVVMNEQGAHYFDTYTDSRGTLLQGEAIGGWDEVTAENASFLSRSHQLIFTLPRIEGARLFRGRELIGTRLAWAGFGYSFAPISQHVAYKLKIERLP